VSCASVGSVAVKGRDRESEVGVSPEYGTYDGVGGDDPGWDAEGRLEGVAVCADHAQRAADGNYFSKVEGRGVCEDRGRERAQVGPGLRRTSIRWIWKRWVLARICHSIRELENSQ
jgi:hypothetical protein